jgi:hypothetical protein
VFVKIDNDDSVHYDISTLWNPTHGIMLSVKDCYVKSPADGYQAVQYNNLFQMQPTRNVLLSKGKGNMKYNSRKLDVMFSKLLGTLTIVNDRDKKGLGLGDRADDLIIKALQDQMTKYQNSGTDYQTEVKYGN